MLELLDLRHRFGDLVALDGLSLDVRPGLVHGFVGRNGAGKTTTMRVALGLLEPDEGQVRWQGRPASADDRRRFGYLPEERGLYPKMSALRQVAYFGELSGLDRASAAQRARALLDRLGLADRADGDVEKLSLGNQQRVQLAVALAPEPDLLVLDEPFSGLDPVGVDVLAGVLREEVARGAGVVFSSHQLELVERLCDTVTIVDRGRVVAEGPIQELRQRRADPRLHVALDGGWTAWAEHVPGVVHSEVAGGELVLELAPGADDQVVLDAARAAGRVRSFRYELPTLVELFREVVAERPDEGTGAAGAAEVAA